MQFIPSTQNKQLYTPLFFNQYTPLFFNQKHRSWTKVYCHSWKKHAQGYLGSRPFLRAEAQRFQIEEKKTKTIRLVAVNFDLIFRGHSDSPGLILAKFFLACLSKFWVVWRNISTSSIFASKLVTFGSTIEISFPCGSSLLPNLIRRLKSRHWSPAGPPQRD